MAIEEKVIQSTTETTEAATTQPSVQPPAPNLDSVKAEYEQQIQELKKQNTESNTKWSEKFNDVKSKLDGVYEKEEQKRKQILEDQGQWKTLWEEANKTAQDKDQQIATLSQQLEELRSSNELATTKQTALASISNLGAVNAEQTLSLLQNKLQKNAEGKVVILNGGVEQDLDSYLTSLKNPGSGWEHHFKPSSAAGMGAKPTPTSNVGGGQTNPWKTGNLTQQMLLSEQNPQLAAVLKQEAQS
tara:strand:- start:178 stop:909 length:732 start_codon:yes stop_codon:yes gene_type:complete